MPSRILLLLIALAPAATLSASQAPGAPLTQSTGVAIPAGALGPGTAISTSLRDALVASLHDSGPAVPLDAQAEAQAAAEAAQKSCAYVLYTRLSQSRGGAKGLMHKMSMLKPQKPSAGEQSADPPDNASLASAQKAIVKAGDTVSLEYRLLSRGTLVSSGKLAGAAANDGDDVLGPLVAQLSTAIATAEKGGATSAADAPSPATGGRRGRRADAASAGAPPAMNCEQMAASSHGTITLEACRQLMGTQQAYASAVADPSASRPGDDNMTCDQIAAEVQQQPIAPVDKGKLAEAQAASADAQQEMAKAEKEVAALAAAQSAESLAEAPLHAFEPNALLAKEQQRRDAEQKAQRERLEAEMQPKAQRQMSSMADLTADIGKQIDGNPRLARLMQLAMQKGCKGR